jgi:WD40 repeat protein
VDGRLDRHLPRPQRCRLEYEALSGCLQSSQWKCRLYCVRRRVSRFVITLFHAHTSSLSHISDFLRLLSPSVLPIIVVLPRVSRHLTDSGNDVSVFVPRFGKDRKIWDTYTGAALHSFPHNHIVRSVALAPTSSHLLTGGQEKKVRIFDLGRPDAEPDLLTEDGTLSHDGTVKSVVWVGDYTGVTASEDGFVK